MRPPGFGRERLMLHSNQPRRERLSKDSLATCLPSYGTLGKLIAMPTKQTPTKSTRKPAELPPATKSVARPRARKAAAAPLDEVTIDPSLKGATTLPAVDPILPPTSPQDEVAAKRAKKAATTTDSAEPKAPRTTAVTIGSMTCRTCGLEKSVTKFPTKAPDAEGNVQRDDQCRECREAKRIAKQAKS